MTTPQRVVVLGGGFAGLYATTYLTKADVPEDALHVTLISDQNYFTFTPLLAEVVAGSLNPQDVIIPLRSLATRFGFEFRRARVEGIDAAGGYVSTTTGAVPFDYLVIALGAAPQYFGNTSLAEASLPFTSVHDALAIRNRALEAAERAAVEKNATTRRDLLRFAVAGAGPSGVEVASEIHSLLTRLLPRYYGVHEPPTVSVYQKADHILPGWDPVLAAEGLELLRARGVDVHLGVGVTSFRNHELETTGNGNTPATARAHTLIWTAGTAPATQILDGGHLARGERKHLVVDQHLRVKAHDNIYAAGDIAQVPLRSGGGFQPPVAPIAISAGIRAAGNIENAIMGRSLEPYDAHHAGKIISLGGGAALIDLLGWRIRGRPAWWTYRLIYLLKLVGTRNKLQALASLTFNRIFEPTV